VGAVEGAISSPSIYFLRLRKLFGGLSTRGYNLMSSLEPLGVLVESACRQTAALSLAQLHHPTYRPLRYRNGALALDASSASPAPTFEPL
jgi:hypothetical protein